MTPRCAGIASLTLAFVLSAHHGQADSDWPTINSLSVQQQSRVEFETGTLHGEALSELFEIGLPDPDGLPYHKVKLSVPAAGTEESNVATEGWLLEPEEGSKTRFAIAWNGLIYPLVGLGEKIELIPQELREEDEGKLDMVHGEAFDILPHRRTLIRFAYLSRLGFEAAAEEIASDKSFNRQDGFLEGASAEWAWNEYARAVTAFRHGDDSRAAASIQHFLKIRPRLPTSGALPQQSWIHQLSQQAEHIERESTRRIGKQILPEAEFLAGKPDTAALIRRLDEVRTLGFHAESIHPVVDALIAEGDAAIEPLLQCLEDDQRLTRYVQIWKGWAPNPHIYSVRQVAHLCLGRLLNDTAMERSGAARYPNFEDVAYFKGLASGIRENWKKHGSTDELGRLLSLLQDDQAKPSQWADAAAALVDRKCIQGELLFRPAAELPNPGRSMDKAQQNAVAPAISSRIDFLLGAKRDDQMRNAHSLKSLFLSLWIWDRDAGEIALQNLLPSDGEEFTTAMSSDDVLAQLLDQLENRSPSVIPLLEASMGSKAPESYMSDLADHFPMRLIFRNANSPEYLDLFRRVQSNPQSPWNFETTSRISLNSLVRTGMQAKGMKHPFFKEALLSSLENQSTGIATITRLKDEPDLYGFEPDQGQRERIPENGPIGIEPGESMELRRCDITAKAMAANLQPRVEFELIWPKEKRDEVVNALIREILEVDE